MSTFKKRKNGSRSPIQIIFDKFSKQKDVELVYGEPITYGKQCIVPVAEVSYSFGVGSGEETSQDDEENEKTNETMLEIGEGGGGHISVKPVGVYKMSEKRSRTRFIPIFDVKFFLKIFSIITLGITFLLRKK